MKRFILILLSVVLAGCFFLVSVGAANYDPIYQHGDSSRSGYWSPVTGYIQGQFSMYMSVDEIYYETISLSYPIQILRDDRDADGNGVCFWVLNMTFSQGFGYNSTLMEYDTIQIVLRSYDQEGYGYLNDLNIIGDGGLKDVLFHTDGTLNSTTYVSDAYLYFGSEQGPNYWYADDYGIEALYTWYMSVFSGPFVNGQISQRLGIFIPVIFQSGGAGPGGGGSGGVIEGGSVNQPSGAFTEFAFLIFDFFRNILSISFFDGFFTLGDLVGVVFAFSLATLFLKWFAGG